MYRLPPRATLTDSLFPFTTLFRSFVVAVAEVVDAAQVGQHLEAELVAQRAAAVMPGVRGEHDAHFAAWRSHVDLGTLEARAQAIGERRRRLATASLVTGLLSHCAAPPCSRRN